MLQLNITTVFPRDGNFIQYSRLGRFDAANALASNCPNVGVACVTSALGWFVVTQVSNHQIQASPNTGHCSSNVRLGRRRRY